MRVWYGVVMYKYINKDWIYFFLVFILVDILLIFLINKKKNEKEKDGKYWYNDGINNLFFVKIWIKKL